MRSHVVRVFLTAAMTLGVCLSVMTPLLADTDPLMPEATPKPQGLTPCIDENADRMFRETMAVYRRFSDTKAVVKHLTAKTSRGKSVSKKTSGDDGRIRMENHLVDLLWRRAPDCSTPEKRAELSHHGLQQYLDATLVAAYLGAVVKMEDNQLDKARFFVDSYFTIWKGTYAVAEAEQWNEWNSFAATSLPTMHKIDGELLQAGVIHTLTYGYYQR